MKINMCMAPAARRTAAWMLMAMGCLSANADNNLRINDFFIAPGETKTLEVILNNDDAIASFQFNLVLPEGLTYSENITRNSDRITRSSHSVAAVQQSDGSYLFAVNTVASNWEDFTIKGEKGTAVFSFDVTASSDYTGKQIENNNKLTDQYIYFYDAEVGVFTDKDHPVTSNSVWMDNTYSRLDVGMMTSAPLADAVPGKVQPLMLSLENDVEIVGLQALVTLPEGVSIAKGADGESFIYSDRLSNDITLSYSNANQAPNTYLILLESITNDVVKVGKGELFGINLCADKAFNGGEVKVNSIKVSTSKGILYNMESEISEPLKAAYSDPNRDGVWDTDDIDLIIDDMLNGKGEALNDVTGDGSVDTDDIYYVIDKFFGF